MIFKKTDHGSVMIGEQEFPINLFRIHYGTDKVTIAPIIPLTDMTTMVFSLKDIEDASGTPISNMSAVKSYLSSIFYASTNSGGSGEPVEIPTWLTLEGKPAVIASGDDIAEARASIGAGTSNLIVGTAASQAKAGNYQPTAANISDASTVGRSILTATDAAAARTAIGAGTSNLTIGTTGTTAMAGNTSLLAIGTTGTTAAAGNHNHAITADAASGLAAAANLQAAFIAMSARVKALEDATPVE